MVTWMIDILFGWNATCYWYRCIFLEYFEKRDPSEGAADYWEVLRTKIYTKQRILLLVKIYIAVAQKVVT